MDKSNWYWEVRIPAFPGDPLNPKVLQVLDKDNMNWAAVNLTQMQYYSPETFWRILPLEVEAMSIDLELLAQ